MRKSLFPRLVMVLLMTGLGLSLSACSKVGYSNEGTDDEVTLQAAKAGFLESNKRASSKNPHKCHQTSEKCYKETFEQPDGETRAVDVLFVVQTSAPIVPERAKIISGLASFIDSLPANADFNIAVMLSHGSTSPHSGRLYRAATEPIVLKSTELSDADIKTYLSAKLAAPPVDPDSGGGEEGMFSLFNAITTPALLADAQSAGMFRPAAALGVVFIGDRRDICAVVPPGVPPEADPIKIDARIRDCEGLTAAGLSNRLQLLKGASPLAVSGLVYVDEPVPDDNEVGYGYIDVIALNAGVAVDLANDDIATGLSSIAELSGSQMEIQDQFTLMYDNVIASSVVVKVNGQKVAFTLSGNTVTLKTPPPAGAVVEISYCVKKKVEGPKKPRCHTKHHFSKKYCKEYYKKNCGRKSYYSFWRH